MAQRSEKVLDNYGVLAAQAVGSRREGGSDTPHYQVEAVDADGLHFRLAVNVLSQEHPSELLYHIDDDLRHPLTAAVPANLGFTRLPPNRNSPAFPARPSKKRPRISAGPRATSYLTRN